MVDFSQEALRLQRMMDRSVDLLETGDLAWFSEFHCEEIHLARECMEAIIARTFGRIYRAMRKEEG
jgi:hypothetical protein